MKIRCFYEEFPPGIEIANSSKTVKEPKKGRTKRARETRLGHLSGDGIQHNGRCVRGHKRAKKDTAIRIYLPGIMESIEPFRLSAAHTEAPQGSKTSWAVKKTGTGLTTGLRSPHEEGE